MTTEELSRIEKQIGKLAGRLNEAYDQIRLNSRRIDDLLEQNRHLTQRLEKAERRQRGFPVTVSPEGEMFVEPFSLHEEGLFAEPLWKQATSASPDTGPKTYVYDHKGICVSETYKVPGAAPFGKEGM